jgi:hypothetical protein
LSGHQGSSSRSSSSECGNQGFVIVIMEWFHEFEHSVKLIAGRIFTFLLANIAGLRPCGVLSVLGRAIVASFWIKNDIRRCHHGLRGALFKNLLGSINHFSLIFCSGRSQSRKHTERAKAVQVILRHNEVISGW